ncbi:MAG: DsbA family protein [Chromatiales bacterium]|nr:DsbA family protein [Chromatiales bacterium]
MYRSRKQYLKAIKVITFLTLFLFIGVANGAESEQQLSRSEIAEIVKEELSRMLNEEGILDSAIDKGIERFIIKQREIARSKQQAASSEKAKNVRPVSVERDHIRGDINAEISLIEYSDYECPFCKRFHPTAQKLIDDNRGTVNWVYRHFPLEFHNPGAQKQAEASECAAEIGGNEIFWKYSDLIYARTKSNGKGFPIDNLVPLAKELGLDEGKFSECLDSGRMALRVQEDYENGVVSGISGTPGNILINNKTKEVYVASGAIPLESLQRIVDQLKSK